MRREPMDSFAAPANQLTGPSSWPLVTGPAGNADAMASIGGNQTGNTSR